MLKSIRVKNFVHFYEEQTLEFVEGAHYFFGQNGTGKSCMVEAIRRCMSTSKNWGISSSHNPSEHSIVICNFEGSTNVISGVVNLPKDTKGEAANTDVYVKFVCKYETKQVFVDLGKKCPNNWTVNEAVLLESEAIEAMVESLFVDFSYDNLLMWVRKYIVGKDLLKEFIKNIYSEYTKTTGCEKYLLNNIDTKVLIAYPPRGFGTVQWTKSRRFSESDRDENRKTVKQEQPERLEIVSWYYNLNADEIADTKTNVDIYFKKITNDTNFHFQKMDGSDKIVAYENHRKEKPLSLGKVPEGYLEAKTCAIMFAMKPFKTICLEEAGRGMHPQMIERMRDLVLEKIRDKVIITTNHLPTFMTAWNIPRVHFFRKTTDHREAPTFNVINGKSILPKDTKNAARMFTNSAYSTIFFARRVLFVEGEKDHIFFSSLRLIMLEDEELTKSLINNLSPNHHIDLELFFEFMYSLHIIALHGHQNKLKFRYVCKTLSLEHYFLLDHDAVIDVNKEDKKKIPMTKQEHPPDIQRSVNPFVDHDDLKSKGIKESDVLKDVACLSTMEDPLFVWRKSVDEYYQGSIAGTIEGALVSLANNEDGDQHSLKKCLQENNVQLKWDETEEKKEKEKKEKEKKEKEKKEEKKEPKYKLFSSKNLTDANIITVVRRVLNACLDSKTSDISRFLCFLFKTAKERGNAGKRKIGTTTTPSRGNAGKRKIGTTTTPSRGNAGKRKIGTTTTPSPKMSKTSTLHSRTEASKDMG